MDREQWTIVLDAVKRASRRVARRHNPKRLRFPDWLIVSMYLWAVLHDRCQSWACDRGNYGGVFRPRRNLPSVSQFNRRMNHARTREVLEQVHEELGGSLTLTGTALSYLDGKPLTVSPASKDPDARRGHVMHGWAKGYKLHAWMSEDRRIPLWCVTPLNAAEAPVAELLVAHGPRELPDRSLTLADQSYDTHDLHKALDRRSGRLLVQPKGGGSAEAPRHPVTLRQMGPARRELLRVCSATPSLLRMVHRQRVNAEGIFGNLCGTSGGLTCLPPWARRTHRVRRWVGGKIILYHARLRVRARLRGEP